MKPVFQGFQVPPISPAMSQLSAEAPWEELSDIFSEGISQLTAMPCKMLVTSSFKDIGLCYWQLIISLGPRGILKDPTIMKRAIVFGESE